uniref:Uncharacterized protein n=1 Tax=Arundo donax TaxID=35708 RepID=A0A0A9A0T0_ARUDO
MSLEPICRNTSILKARVFPAEMLQLMFLIKVSICETEEMLVTVTTLIPHFWNKKKTLVPTNCAAARRSKAPAFLSFCVPPCFIYCP